jgi:hypothetical protein
MYYYYINSLEGSLAPAEAPVTLVFAVKQQQLQVVPCSHLQLTPPASLFAVVLLISGFYFSRVYLYNLVCFCFLLRNSPCEQLLESMFWAVSSPSSSSYGHHLSLQVRTFKFSFCRVGLQCRASKHKPSIHHNPTLFISCILQHKPQTPNPLPGNF